jgi:hypothetical protein
MKPIILLILAGIMASCGPLSTPMVDRPSENDQKQLDTAWDRALSPIGKLNRQEWLDLFVGAQAYQAGVDKLHMRSEKAFSGGSIVMEVHYDRESPGEDGFEVSVFDEAGKLVRNEKFSRQDVETTRRDLFSAEVPEDEEERLEFEAEHQARWEKILEYFPNARKKNESD